VTKLAAQPFDQLLTHLPMAVALTDPDLRVLYVNLRWLSDYQLTLPAVMGVSLTALFPQWRDDWARIREVCLAGGEHHDAEVLLRREDAVSDWVKREARPWMTSQGVIGGLMVFTEIVTERKRAQDEFRTQHHFLRQVIDLNTSFIFAKDISGRFTLINKALADAYGTTPDDAIGKYDADFNPIPHETDHFKGDDLEVLRTRTPKFIPEECVTHVNPSQMRWYQTIKVPIISDDGRDVQLLGVSTDITERKRAEEKLQQSVIQEQAARRAAEAALQMRDLLLGNMSHELRTPLNAIIGFLREMLYSQQLDDDNIHMAERALANSKRLSMLVNGVLDLSRLAVGSLELVVSEINLRGLVNDIIEDMGIQAKEKRLPLILSIDPALPPLILHDEERLTQIITNLLVNAIKFTSEGHIKLVLERGSLDDLVIKVYDTGIGIPEGKQTVIFDSFIQLRAAPQGAGVGLGLSIVKNLAHLMGGTVALESRVGEYSIFSVKIPLNLPDSPSIG